MLATPQVAAAAGPHGVVPLQIEGEQIAARIVGVVERFPSIVGDAVVADRVTAATMLDTRSPGLGTTDELWLNDGRAPARRRNCSCSRAPTTLARLQADPLARGALLTLAGTAAVALLLALVGLLLGVVGDVRDDRGELFDLEAQGAAPATIRAHLRLRALLVGAVRRRGRRRARRGAVGARDLARLGDRRRRRAGAAAPARRSTRRCSRPRRSSTRCWLRCSSWRRRRLARPRAASAAGRRLRDMSAIELRDVFRVHSTPEGDAAALQGLSLRVEDGEVLTVLGPSGSGKSTLLRLLAGLERPSAGIVRVYGEDVGKLPGAPARPVPLDAARLRRPALRARARAGADRARARRDATRAPRHGRAPTRFARADELLERVGLAAKRDRRPAELSGGEQQRVALCAALAHRPQVFLADEPTGELDAATADQVYEMLGELVREHRCTTVIVSHDPESARIADRIVRIRDGRVSEEWAPRRR